MQPKHWLYLWIGLTLLSLLAACGTPTPPAATGSPQDTVAAFYAWYDSFEGSPLGGRVYRDSEYLSPEFIRELDALVDSFEAQGGGAFDPFICAQDGPETITVIEAEGTPELTHVTVQAWQPIVVDVKLVDWTWQIVAIHCTPPGDTSAAPRQPALVEPPPEATPEPAPTESAPSAEPPAETPLPVVDIPADWVYFEDVEHGFSLYLPADWETQQLLPRGGDVPDGEKARKYTWLLQPQGWDGIAAPLHIEVTEGTAAQFERLYPPPSASEEIVVNGYPAIQTIESYGEIFIARHILPHPALADVRIVFQDTLSGFPARLAGNEAVSETLLQIIHTVTFE